MRTREVAEICGVTEECIRQNAKKIGMEFGYGEFINHDWTEDELKRIQVQLMKNQVNQGAQTGVVKEQSQSALELGALTIAATQSVEATQQLCNVLMQKAQQFEALQLEQQRNQQLQLENNQLTHALEYDKVKDWRPWSTVKAELKPKFEIFRHRIGFYDVVNDVGLIKGEDYEEKVMGRDTRPTKLISSEGEDKIFDWYDTHTF